MTTRFAVIAISAFFATSVASPALAAPSSCDDGKSTELSREQVVGLGLIASASTFEESVRDIRLDPEKIRILVRVVDCPYFGHVIRSVRMLAEAASSRVPLYYVYLTTAYLRNRTEPADLTRDARRQVCIIRTGEADDRNQKTPDGVDSKLRKHCMLDSAVRAGDMEYATALARQLGEPVPMPPGSRADETSKSIQNAIDSVRRMPDAPDGAHNALEKLRDSLRRYPPPR